MRTWFITGGSPGGFGAAYADAALARGDRVVLTARQPGALRDWATRHGSRALVLPLDVTDLAQIRQAVMVAEQRFGGIDVLVNNAGRGWYGSVEGMPDAAVRNMFELNFFAAVAVIRAVLPGMRRRRSGWIINMSSAAGLAGVTGFGYYSASKAAVDSISEVLRREVAPLGINVLTVVPGAFRTRAYAGFAGQPAPEDIADYRPMLESVRTSFTAQDGRQPGDPNRGIAAVIAAMNQDQPPDRLTLGGAAYDTTVNHLQARLAAARANETLSRSADFPDYSSEPDTAAARQPPSPRPPGP